MLSIYIAGKIRKDRDVKFRPADYNVMTEEEYIAAMPVPVVIENSDIDNFFSYSGPFAIGCDHGCYHGDESHGARGCNKIKLDDGSESRVGCQCEPALDKELVYETCKRQIKQSDVFLAWIDSSDCYGTLVEIGFAKAAGIPVYIVFADGIDKSDFWFVAQFGRVLSGTILQVLRTIKNYHLALNMDYQYPFLQPIYEGEIIKVVSRPCYLVVTELQRYGLSKKDKSFPIKYAVSKSGQYIGTPRDAWRLVNVAGISVFERRTQTSKICTIGYCLHKRKWYGWSHRAIAGFKKKEDARRFAASVR